MSATGGLKRVLPPSAQFNNTKEHKQIKGKIIDNGYETTKCRT